MNDSFPIEALKAQAIAARTYAMRAKAQNKSKAYDVVDTTQDQVYKGYDDKLTQIIKAVDTTRGIVGMSDGTYAQCYYTASNGGQIASTKQVWGGSVSYIEMKDDPYDLENSLSVEKSAFVPKDLTEGSALERALAEQVLPYVPDAYVLRADTIVNVSLSDPDVTGSLMYKTLTFEVAVSERTVIETEPSAGDDIDTATPSEAEEAIADTQTEATSEFIPLNSGMIDATPGEATPSEAELTEPEPELSEFTPVPGTYTVKLQTYGCLKSLLGIGINSASYEVFYLDNAKDGWTLTARRFGHGVGMSQRGAQTMAGRHGMDCEEILGFYYPGLTLYVIDWTQQSLTPISALPESLGYARPRPTPRPTQAPLPALKAGEYYARVTLQSSASTLNVRSQPNTSCSIVALLYNNERVIVTGSFEDNWVSIKTVEFTGYVKADYLKNE